MNRVLKHLGKLPEKWCEEIGLQDPSLPTKGQVKKAWDEIGEISTTHQFINDLFEAIQIVKRDPDAKPEHIAFVKRYGQRISKLYFISKDIIGDLARDFERENSQGPVGPVGPSA